jgi:hypothetical protein
MSSPSSLFQLTLSTTRACRAGRARPEREGGDRSTHDRDPPPESHAHRALARHSTTTSASFISGAGPMSKPALRLDLEGAGRVAVAHEPAEEWQRRVIEVGVGHVAVVRARADLRRTGAGAPEPKMDHLVGGAGREYGGVARTGVSEAVRPIVASSRANL